MKRKNKRVYTYDTEVTSFPIIINSWLQFPGEMHIYILYICVYIYIYLYIYVIQGKSKQHIHKNISATVLYIYRHIVIQYSVIVCIK